MRQFYVYILASRSRNLYTGITSNLVQRVYQHKQKQLPGFTARYNIHRLVYYETYQDVRLAISREKEIKKWKREQRVALIESVNPTWEDLSAEWYERESLDTG